MFTHLADRAILRLHGPDTLTLLERLVTNDTSGWAEGETRYGALLTPQGKVIADYLAVRTADGVWLDVARPHIEDLAKRLKLFRLRSKVEIEIAADLAVLASSSADAIAPDGSTLSYRDPRYPGGRTRAIVGPDLVAAASLDRQAYHADRIAHAIPEQGVDFGTADVFPADINMDVLSGVALNKGCFVGQEVVSRMHRRGKIRKRTLRIDLLNDATFEPGATVSAQTPIGSVTSVSERQALALVRIDRLFKAEAEDETIRIDDSSVRIEKPDWLMAELTAIDEA